MLARLDIHSHVKVKLEQMDICFHVIKTTDPNNYVSINAIIPNIFYLCTNA